MGPCLHQSRAKSKRFYRHKTDREGNRPWGSIINITQSSGSQREPITDEKKNSGNVNTGFIFTAFNPVYLYYLINWWKLLVPGLNVPQRANGLVIRVKRLPILHSLIHIFQGSPTLRLSVSNYQSGFAFSDDMRTYQRDLWLSNPVEAFKRIRSWEIIYHKSCASRGDTIIQADNLIFNP